MMRTAIDPVSGRISVYNYAGNSDLLVDVQGCYLVPSGDATSFFVPVTTGRIDDSRSGSGTGGEPTPLAARSAASVPIRGATIGGTVAVPSDASVTAAMHRYYHPGQC